MSRNKKPRKAYRPRIIAVNTLELAMHHAAKPPAVDRAEVLSVLAKAIKALREGVSTEVQWSIAAGAVAVAKAIESQGIVRGLHEHLAAVDQALQGIYARAMHAGDGAWGGVTLYYQELDALQTFMELHTFQIDQLGRDELLAAMNAAHKVSRAQGYTTTMARDLQQIAA